MTELLDKAIRRIRRLSPEEQDEAAEVLLDMVDQDPDTVRLTPDQIAEIEAILREPPTYASEEQVEALFRELGA